MINIHQGNVNGLTIKIQLCKFLYYSEQRPLTDVERPMRTEFPATETADAGMVIEGE
jgi:hypothetical protein